MNLQCDRVLGYALSESWNEERKQRVSIKLTKRLQCLEWKLYQGKKRSKLWLVNIEKALFIYKIILQA